MGGYDCRALVYSNNNDVLLSDFLTDYLLELCDLYVGTKLIGHEAIKSRPRTIRGETELPLACMYCQAVAEHKNIVLPINNRPTFSQ